MLGINIGIDLGTTSIIIYIEGKGIVLSEPSAAAYDAKTGRLIAVGKKAYEMFGRTPDSIKVIKPLRDGVVSDFTATRHILKYFLQKICRNMVFKPNIVVCVPSSVTNLEKRTILELVISSGAGRACLIEEPLAAALGAGLRSDKPMGTMVVDIGGGTTDVAVMTMGSISVSQSIKCAGNAFDESIMRQIKNERDILIGEITAENIKKQIGCAQLREDELGLTVKGKHYITGMPVSFELTSTEVFLAMRQNLELIAETVSGVLQQTLPELAADVFTTGIYLTGGGALIQGFDKMIEEKTGVKTYAALDPLNCVAKGIGIALKNQNILFDNGETFKTGDQIGEIKSEINEEDVLI